jgi:hypothetical protein
MTIHDLLTQGRAIWGDRRMSAAEITIATAVNLGDMSRYVRDRSEGRPADEAQLKKELGNMIFSTIRWCDDLGFSPEECIELAKQAQSAYQQR